MSTPHLQFKQLTPYYMLAMMINPLCVSPDALLLRLKKLSELICLHYMSPLTSTLTAECLE